MKRHQPLYAAVVFSIVVIGCTDVNKGGAGKTTVNTTIKTENDKPKNNSINKETSEPEVIREFNVEDPNSFVIAQFKAEPKPKEVLGIDENGVVQFFNQEKTIELPSELIVVSRAGPRISIRVNSQPMSLDDAKLKSISMCELVGISDERITEWFSSKKYEDILTSDCLQIGRVNNQSHSVEIGSSFDASLPWSISYVVTYSNK